jgi:hypothetical protein
LPEANPPKSPRRLNKMEIQSLRLLATEEDLNGLIAERIPQMKKIRGLRVKVLPEGISITGSYQTLIEISFEALWEVFIHEGKIAARLQRLKSGGLGMGLLKGYLLQAISSATNMIEIQGETLLFDLDVLLKERGIPLRTNLSSVRCSDGRLMIESSRATA